MKYVNAVLLAILAGFGFFLGGALDAKVSEPEVLRLPASDQVVQTLVSHDGELTATIICDEQDRWYCQVWSNEGATVGPLVVLEPPIGTIHALSWGLDSQELMVELGAKKLIMRPREGSVEPR